MFKPFAEDILQMRLREVPTISVPLQPEYRNRDPIWICYKVCSPGLPFQHCLHMLRSSHVVGTAGTTSTTRWSTGKDGSFPEANLGSSGGSRGLGVGHESLSEMGSNHSRWIYGRRKRVRPGCFPASQSDIAPGEFARPTCQSSMRALLSSPLLRWLPTTTLSSTASCPTSEST